jgi:hypothetical protein
MVFLQPSVVVHEFMAAVHAAPASEFDRVVEVNKNVGDAEQRERIRGDNTNLICLIFHYLCAVFSLQYASCVSLLVIHSHIQPLSKAVWFFDLCLLEVLTVAALILQFEAFFKKSSVVKTDGSVGMSSCA